MAHNDFSRMISVPSPAVHIYPSDRQIKRGTMVIGGSRRRVKKLLSGMKWNWMWWSSYPLGNAQAHSPLRADVFFSSATPHRAYKGSVCFYLTICVWSWRVSQYCQGKGGRWGASGSVRNGSGLAPLQSRFHVYLHEPVQGPQARLLMLRTWLGNLTPTEHQLFSGCRPSILDLISKDGEEAACSASCQHSQVPLCCRRQPPAHAALA